MCAYYQMKVVSATNVFIDSELNVQRNGSSYRVHFPSDMFSTKSSQQMRLTLASFDMRRNWFSVNQTNSSFYCRIKDKRAPNAFSTPTVPLQPVLFFEVNIPHGTYESFNELCRGVEFGLKQLYTSVLTNVNLWTDTANTTELPITGGSANDVKVGYQNYSPSAAVPPVTTYNAGDFIVTPSAVGFPNQHPYNRRLMINLTTPAHLNPLYDIDFVSFQVKDESRLATVVPGVSAAGFFNDVHELVGGAPTRDKALPKDGVCGGSSTTGTLAITDAGSNWTAGLTENLTGIRDGQEVGTFAVYSFTGGPVTAVASVAAGEHKVKVGDVITITNAGGAEVKVTVTTLTFDSVPCVSLLDQNPQILSPQGQQVPYLTQTTAAYMGYYPAALNSLECVYLRTNLINDNYSTFGMERSLPNQQGIVATDVLARVPLTTTHFDSTQSFLVYDDSNDLYSVMFQRGNLDSFEFRLTDDKGRDIPEVGDLQTLVGMLSFKFVLRFEVLVDEESQMLEEMRANNFRPGQKVPPLPRPLDPDISIPNNFYT